MDTNPLQRSERPNKNFRRLVNSGPHRHCPTRRYTIQRLITKIRCPNASMLPSSFVFSRCPPSSPPPLSNLLHVSVGGIRTSCRTGDWSLKKLNSTQDQKSQRPVRLTLSFSRRDFGSFVLSFPPTFQPSSSVQPFLIPFPRLPAACRLLGSSAVSSSLQLLSLCHF